MLSELGTGDRHITGVLLRAQSLEERWTYPKHCLRINCCWAVLTLGERWCGAVEMSVLPLMRRYGTSQHLVCCWMRCVSQVEYGTNIPARALVEEWGQCHAQVPDLCCVRIFKSYRGPALACYMYQVLGQHLLGKGYSDLSGCCMLLE